MRINITRALTTPTYRKQIASKLQESKSHNCTVKSSYIYPKHW